MPPVASLTLTDPLTKLPGVGPKLAEKLTNLGLRQCQDLLFHLPLRYEDRTSLWPLGELTPAMRVQVIGRVEHANVQFGRRRSLLVSLSDGSGRLGLRFFHFSKAQMQQFTPGQWVRCFGDVRPGPRGLEMAHPEYALVASQEQGTQSVDAALTAIYPVTTGVTSPRLRGLVARVLDGPLGTLPDPLGALPAALGDLPSLHEALRILHRPPVGTDLAEIASGYHPAQQRLAFEELLAHHLSLTRLKHRLKHSLRATPLPPANSGLRALFAELGFAPTGAQRRVIQEIQRDLAEARPMMRLVQGDVGSGKTVVAAAALVTAVANGKQAALMAPTELLAEQHATTLGRWLGPLDIDVVLLTGRLTSAQKKKALTRLESGKPCVAVGTHALFQATVSIPNLALAVVDEQHRFGVHQRLSLLDKAGQAAHPHQLIMTATPIPRTLAMQAYANLDTSIIDELPPGRTPVTTVAINRDRREHVIERVRAACAAGRQAYWVCTLVETSEHLDAEAAEDTATTLREACPQLRIGLAHGQLKAAAKADVMAQFKAGELDVLVATTVIEVGVDVPNASVMVIDNAERLGLAQLHQLRGRVGRGSTVSHCVLLYQMPLSANAKSRLGVMRDSNDGFVIAEKDLELRGPGEVLGTRQTGDIGMRVADLVRDADLVDLVQRYASGLGDQHEALTQVLAQRWLSGAEEFVRA